MDLAKLDAQIAKKIFEIDTQSLGRLRCQAMTFFHASALYNYNRKEKPTSRQLAQRILVLIAERLNDEQANSKISDEEAAQLTNEEINRFARELVEHDQIGSKRENVREKEETEEDIDYLNYYISDRIEPLGQLTESIAQRLINPIGSQATAFGTLREHARLVETLHNSLKIPEVGTTLGHIVRPEISSPNLTFESPLLRIAANMEISNELHEKTNRALGEMLESQEDEAKKNTALTKRIIFMTGIVIVISLIGLGFTIVAFYA